MGMRKKEGKEKKKSRPADWGKSLTKKICRQLLRLTKGRLPGRAAIEDSLRLLNTGSDIQGKLEDYYSEKIALVLKVFAGGAVLTLLVIIAGTGGSMLTEGYYLTRGEESYTEELILMTVDGSASSVEVEVEPRELTSEESTALLEAAVEDMESYILGDNLSLEEVRSDLNLMDEIEGTPITVEWDMDTYEALNLDGSLRTKNLTEEGTVVVLTATLTCYGETMIWQAAAQVFSPELSAEEEWLLAVDEAVSAAQEESSQDELKSLPRSIAGLSVGWEEEGSSNVFILIALTLVCAAAVFFAGDQDLKKEVKNREIQMELDYSRIVGKLVLLTAAGATIRTAWETIVRDYLAKRSDGREERRYAFEEMALSCREMENGVAEAKAYENFGMRCRLPCYQKLAALLEQNIKKGSKGLSLMLKAEIGDAFEQRKAAAVKRGEEASTKLLVPMVMLLAVAMIMIMVPAGMSMQL